MTRTRTFRIQVQLERLVYMRQSDVVSMAQHIQQRWPETAVIEIGDHQVNLLLQSNDPQSTWERIRRSFVSTKLFGDELNQATIITVSGYSQWGSCVLLHHYDRTEPIEPLPMDQLDDSMDSNLLDEEFSTRFTFPESTDEFER